MREQGFKLTQIGSCDNPRCVAPVYVELLEPHGYRLCVDCEERHGERLRALARHAPRLPDDPSLRGLVL
jgi:hypothetical protein